jgi:ribose/xylose/arabinose/galactoside ABC-type transport system permease subunit
MENSKIETCKKKYDFRLGNERFRRLISQYSALPVLVLLIIVASLTSDVFLTGNNIINVLRQVAANGIISIGMTYVILTGGIDISVGSIVGISSIMFASSFQPEGFVKPYSGISNFIRLLVPDESVAGVLVAGLIVIIICAALGLINGLGVTKGMLPPFIMTMGTLTLFRGIALLVCEGRPLYMSESYAEKISWLGSARVLNIPAPVIVFAIVAVV